MRKSNIFRRALSFLLSFAMVLGTFAVTASAGTVFNQKVAEVNGNSSAKVVVTGQLYYGNDPANPRYEMNFQEDTKKDSKIRVRYKVYAPHETYHSVGSLCVQWNDLLENLDGARAMKSGNLDLELISPKGNAYSILQADSETFLFYDENGPGYEMAEWADKDNDLYVEFDLILTVTNQKTFQEYLEKGALNVTPDKPKDENGNYIEYYSQVRTYATNAEGWHIPEEVSLDDLALQDGIELDVSEDLYDVVYNGNGAMEGGDTLPKATKAIAGKPFEIPNTVALKKIVTINGEDVPHVLSGWDVKGTTNGTDYPPTVEKGGTFTMPAADVTLWAAYAPDRNGDDVDDKKQVEVTYTVKSGSEDGIEKVEYKLTPDATNVTAFTDMTKLKSVIVNPDTALGDLAANVLPKTGTADTWKFKQYNVTTTAGGNDSATLKTFDELKAHKVPNVEGAKQTVEIEMMIDNNGNDIDDEDLVPVTINYNGQKVGEVMIPDGVKDFVVTPPGEAAKPAKPIQKDPTTGAGTVNLTNQDVPDKYQSRPLDLDNLPWPDEAFDATGDLTGDGKNDLKITPQYKDKADKVDVDFPGPVIDGTDPDKEKDDIIENDPTIPLQGDAIVIFRNEKGNVITANGYNKVTPEQINGANPEFVYPVVPAKKNGAPHTAWKITGITQPGAGETFGDPFPAEHNSVGTPHYYADPFYDETKVKLEIVQPGDPDDKVIFPDDPTNPVEVFPGTEIVITDEDGNPVDTQTVTKEDKENGKTVTLPEDSTMSPTNEAGDYFTGEWKVTPEDTDNPKDGIPDKYVVTPVYGAPDDDDVEIIPDPDPDPEDPEKPDGKNELTGNGYKVLKGQAGGANDRKAVVYFYIKAKDSNGNSAPLSGKKVGDIKVNIAASNSFAAGTYGTLGTLQYDKEVELNGEKYGAFFVEYTMQKSGIVTITATYGQTGAYDVIMVGNVDKMGQITSLDVGLTKRYSMPANAPKAITEDGKAGYFFELANADKLGQISSLDVGLVKKLSIPPYVQ